MATGPDGVISGTGAVTLCVAMLYLISGSDTGIAFIIPGVSISAIAAGLSANIETYIFIGFLLFMFSAYI